MMKPYLMGERNMQVWRKPTASWSLKEGIKDLDLQLCHQQMGQSVV
jgi:hypothetical protein